MEHLTETVSGKEYVMTQSPGVPPLTKWPQGIEGPLQYVPAACNFVASDLTGKIALVDLHSMPMCMIDVKAANVFAAGAIGMVLINKVDNYISPGMSGQSAVDIPIVLVQKSDGEALKAQPDVLIKLSPNNRQISPYFQQPEGLVVIDFSNPDVPVKKNIRTDFSSAHNVYVEEDRPYLYVVGMTRLLNFSQSEYVSNGGMLIYSVEEDPLNPVQIGAFDKWYVHDVVVQKCLERYLLIAAHIFDGRVSIVDVTNPRNLTILATWKDRFSTAHNAAWGDDACQFVYVTHELPFAPVSLWRYDLNEIGSPNYGSPPHNEGGLSVNQFSGSMAHNVFRRGNWMFASYYETGSIVWDISTPNAPKLAAQYLNTASAAPSSIWGMFPYSSDPEIIYVTDINNGLEVLRFQDGSTLPAGCPLPKAMTSSAIGLLALFLVALIVIAGLVVYIVRERRLKKANYEPL